MCVGVKERENVYGKKDREMCVRTRDINRVCEKEIVRMSMKNRKMVECV